MLGCVWRCRAICSVQHARSGSSYNRCIAVGTPVVVRFTVATMPTRVTGPFETRFMDMPGILLFIIVLSFAHRDFFSSFCRSFVVPSAPGHARSPPEHHDASLGPGRGRGTCSGGSKWGLTTGRHPEHEWPPGSMQTHVQAKTMSDDSCGI